MNSSELGKIIRFHRKKANLTQGALASMAGVAKTTVYEIESARLSPTLETLMKICFVLNLAFDFESPLMAEYRAEVGRS